MMRGVFVSLVILWTGGLWAKPNAVVFLTDDQGWGDLSMSGNSNLSTPHLDSLAKDGASFDRFYVCPVCSPTRAEFLTGRHHARSGVYSTSAGGERMDLDETTIADLFKKAGYSTGHSGNGIMGCSFLSSSRPRVRLLLRFLLRALGALFRSLVGTQRRAGSGQRFLRGRFHERGDEFH